MKWKLVILTITSVSLLGCSLYRFNAPPKDDYEMWHKPGADELEVKKALLECGKPGLMFPFGTDEETVNGAALSEFCMEKAGFKSDSPASNYCRAYSDKKLSACRPGAVIPDRSVAKRLNSPYCKKYSFKNDPVCQP